MDDAKVLLVGHCNFDSGRIVAALKKAGCSHVISADSVDEGYSKVKGEKFNLVIANRVISAEEDGGLQLVRKIKADEAVAETPVMVLSSFREVQKEAMVEGAVQGVGKDILESEEAVDEFKKYVSNET